MKHLRLTLLAALALGGLASALPINPSRAAAATGPTVSTTQWKRAATVNFSAIARHSLSAATHSGLTMPRYKVNRPIPASGSGGPGLRAAAPVAMPLTGADSGFSGFDGLSSVDNRNANGFDVEPPDQGLCAGNGFLVEGVNLAVQVYSQSGANLSGVTSLNSFFGLTPDWFVSDPKCYFDSDTGRFFFSALSFDLSGNAYVNLAVSQTGDPTGSWTPYTLYVGADGGSNCPCFGDQPLLGADANGIWISTNSFSVFGPQFYGAQVYGASKAALAAGAFFVPVVHFGNLLAGANTYYYSLQPATSPSSQYNLENGGTEYFVGSTDFSGTGDYHITLWAATNSSALNTVVSNVNFAGSLLTSEPYLQPIPAQQKLGPIPLGNYFGAPEGALQTNDDRMNQVVYAHGLLWTALNTRLGLTGNGIAYFVVKPSPGQGPIGATIAKQGYLAANDANLMYPSIGVDPLGQGVISFSLSGPDNYPSTGYVRISLEHGLGALHVAGVGTAPDDGFTVYLFGGAGRWGDYSAAVYDPNSGQIAIAAEYIPGGSERTFYANWGTFVGETNQYYLYG